MHDYSCWTLDTWDKGTRIPCRILEDRIGWLSAYLNLGPHKDQVQLFNKPYPLHGLAHVHGPLCVSVLMQPSSISLKVIVSNADLFIVTTQHGGSMFHSGYNELQ
ncbi:hypothetical protein Salat_2477100 [Sesamum alatum]|uniref:Uncharacterized protein n=1 Tax=Sesamum alatum TaxID=300844 RepID=A0AAE1XRA2_9LAMI|nr:hypothetical protein Salat_2477100 [Sesamum alatum]